MALGGMTAEELDYRMSAWELRGWQLFEEYYGPLHASVRLEGAIARAVMPFIKNPKTDYFMPWPKDEGDEGDGGSIQDALKLLKGVKADKRTKAKRRNRRRKGEVKKRGSKDGKSQSR